MAFLSPYVVFVFSYSALKLELVCCSSRAGTVRDHSNTDRRVITDSVKCYSCMSKFYGGLWEDRLQSTYTKPQNFSDLCDEGRRQTSIGLVECQSICISIKEETVIGGYPVTGYIRGCYKTMLRRGFNETIVQWYRWKQRDSCHYYNQQAILKLPQTSSNDIWICTCYSDGCNGVPKLSGGAFRSAGFLWRVFMALILICHWSDASAAR